MVAKVEDSFSGKEQGFGGHRLLGPGPWGGRWSHGGGGVQQFGVGGVREGDAALLHGSGCSFYAASRSGDLPTWPSHQHQQLQHPHLGSSSTSQGGIVPVRLNAIAVPESVSVTTSSDGFLSSFVSSYLMAQSQAAQPGRANCLAPGSGGGGQLARNSSFESTTSGSCSTPSFCVGSPATVFPSRPCDSGSKDSATSDRHHHQLLSGDGGLVVGAAYSGSKGPQPSQHQPQLSDPYNLSTDSLSYVGSLEGRDAIANCVGGFWSNASHTVGDDVDVHVEPLQLPEFRFEPMLDDTAMSFSGVGELDSLVATVTHVPTHRPMRGFLPAMTPDFCQYFAGDHDGEIKPPPIAGKPAQLAISAKSSVLAALNANSGSDHGQGGRLRWSDQPWVDAAAPQQLLVEKSPTSFAGSSPSSPTTPLDPHLFATQTPSATLSEDEIRKKLTEFSTAGSSKRSFATMVGELEAAAPTTTTSAPTVRPGPNADKFDAAALSALLYNNSTQTNPEFRSATTSTASPAPKQRRRHGTATDPQSIAARTRREKFTDRIRVLQSLVPNGERLDTVHMLSQTFEYVRFLQHKVWDLYNNQDSLSELKCEKWKEFVDSATGQVLV